MATTDTNRWLQLKTPLGRDQMILTGFSGEEAINGFFSFRLDVISLKAVGDTSAIDAFHGTAWRLAFGATTLAGVAADAKRRGGSPALADAVGERPRGMPV